MNSAKLYAIGVGPGDPELLTLKAKRILEEVDILFIPYSQEEKRSLAYSIVSEIIPRECKIIKLYFPMSMDKAILQESWEKAAHTIKKTLGNGENAAYISLGDPLTYSTFTYILRVLEKEMSVLDLEIIPGISSYQALAARAKKALAEGNEKLLIIPALNSGDEIKKHMNEFENIVCLKAGKTYAHIASLIEETDFPFYNFLASRIGFTDELVSENIKELNQELDYLTSILLKKEQ